MSTAEGLEMQVSVIEFLCFVSHSRKAAVPVSWAVNCLRSLQASLGFSELICMLTPPKPLAAYWCWASPWRGNAVYCLLFLGQSGNAIVSQRNPLGVWGSS